MKRGSISKKLGVATVGPLTKEICKKKVSTLKAGIKRGRYKGKLLEYAKYYANWYAWRANNKRAA